MTATVALTGGTGFVGGAIAHHLSRSGYRLRLLVRRPGAPGLPADAVTVPGSLGDRNSLSRLLEGAEAVVHAAGAIKAIDAEEFLRVNRDGAAAIAEEALRAGIERFVLISSIAARSPLVSLYAGSKRAGESEVLGRLGPTVVAILRPPVVYGPGDRETLPLFRAARFGFFPVLGPPEARLSFIHVADIAAAVAAVIAARKQPAGVFETDDGTAGGYGWSEISAALGAAVGRAPRQIPVPAPVLRLAGCAALALARVTGRPPMLRPDKVNELRHPDWACRDSRLTEATGWRPRFALADGFRDTVAWYRARGLLK